MKMLSSFLFGAMLSSQVMAAAYMQNYSFDDASEIATWSTLGGNWEVTPSHTLRFNNYALDADNLILTDIEWTYGTTLDIEVDVKYSGTAMIGGVVWGYESSKHNDFLFGGIHNALFSEYGQHNTALIRKQVNNHSDIGLSDSGAMPINALSPNTWYHLRVSIDLYGHTKLFIDNVLYAQSNMAATSGYVGLGQLSGSGGNVEYDNLSIYVTTDLSAMISYADGVEAGRNECIDNPQSCGIQTCYWFDRTFIFDIFERTANQSFAIEGYIVGYGKEALDKLYIDPEGNVFKLEAGSDENGLPRWREISNVKKPAYASVTFSKDHTSVRFGSVKSSTLLYK